MKTIITFIILFSSTISFAQDNKPVNWGPARTKSQNSASNPPKKRATSITLNSTEDGDGRYYKTSGTISFTVEGKTYTRSFENVEFGGFSETELTNQDNDDIYYPVARISKPLDSDETTMTVVIYERTWGFDDYLGLVTKRLK